MDCIKMVVAMNKETSILIQTNMPIAAQKADIRLFGHQAIRLPFQNETTRKVISEW